MAYLSDGEIFEKWARAENDFIKVEIERIVREYSRQMFEHLRRSVTEKAAEDLIQQTWLKVFKNAKQYHQKPGATLKAWVFKININNLNSFLRANPPNRYEEADVLESIPSHLPNPRETQDSERLRRDFNACLCRLPEKLREVTLASIQRDLTQIAMAMELGVSRTTVWKLFQAAAQRIRDCLREKKWTESEIFEVLNSGTLKEAP